MNILIEIQTSDYREYDQLLFKWYSRGNQGNLSHLATMIAADKCFQK